MNNKIFLLKIEKEENCIILNISEEKSLIPFNFSRKISLIEIKNIHKLFSSINSFNEFIDYIKAAYENKKLEIELKDERLLFKIEVEYFFKQQIIEIPFFAVKVKSNDIITNLCQELSILKEKIKNFEENNNKNNDIMNIIDKQNKEINYLKDELNKIKDENNNLKEENNKLKEDNIKINRKIVEIIELLKEKEDLKDQTLKRQEIAKNTNNISTILINEEYDMIFNAIKTRMKKKVKEIKKLYQAKVDGGNPEIFHKKCDNISNTLILIKSAGNRRFGGFTSKKWNSVKDYYVDDNNAFIFSLDEKKVYPYKNDGKAIYCRNAYGPCFGYGYDIGIVGDPIFGKYLKTFKSSSSFDYDGNNAVSEDENYKGIYANDYEVFQVIFDV